MTKKNKTLQILEQNQRIESPTNKSYGVLEDNDVISVEGIRAFLNEKAPVRDIFVYESVASTNQTAKQLSLGGAKNGSVVVADGQTAGQGRMGRGFFSPPGSGIYMSVILRPEIKAEQGALITTSASVAVCRAIERNFGIYPKIKWVNDIILNERKICGILTEAVMDSETGRVGHVVLGIGINVKTSEFPQELEKIAGSLTVEGETGITRNRIIADVLNGIFELLDGIETGYFIDEYRKRLIVLGREIEIIKHNETQRAKAIDIDNTGGLIVEMADGERRVLTSDEISIRGDFYA